MKRIEPNEDFVNSLTALPLFQNLNACQRLALLECASIIACDAGETLFREGDPAESFFILKTGRVKMRKISPSGREVVLHLSAPPHMIGCKSLTLPNSLYPADAVAVDTVIALQFTRESFLEKCAGIAGVFFELLIDMNRRLSEIYTLQSALQEPVGMRIATLLLNQALPADADLDQWHVYSFKAIQITKRLIASIVGTTTETAIRVLSRWKKKGWISSERGLIKIEDGNALYQLSLGADPGEDVAAKGAMVV